MENIDKGLKVQKWVPIVWLKIPQMPQNLSAQFVCPCPKVWDFDEKASLGVRSPWTGSCLSRVKRPVTFPFFTQKPTSLPQENGEIQYCLLTNQEKNSRFTQKTLL